MAVYADILFLVNSIVDYFLLLLAGLLLHKKSLLWRQIVASFTGGIFSFYIFLPQQHALFEILINSLMCAVLCLIAFGFNNLKSFSRSLAVLFVVNFAYTGGMIAVWYIFKPYGMVINNSVIYFNISPLFLIIFSVVGYFLVVFFRNFVAKSFPKSAECKIQLFFKDNSINLEGIVDTGNSLKDGFGISEIIIIDASTAKQILHDCITETEKNSRYRAIPCSTVSGVEILDGYRIDSAIISYNKKIYKFKNPVLAISKSPLVDCKAIVNPESL